MKTKLTIIVISIYATFSAYAIKEVKNNSWFSVMDFNVDSDSFPAKIENYINTSGLYSSPESLREYGVKWKSDESALLHQLSTNAVMLAQRALTNATNAAELREIFEFLISPASLGKIVPNKRSDIYTVKCDVLSDCFLLQSGGESIPHEKTYYYTPDKDHAEDEFFAQYGHDKKLFSEIRKMIGYDFAKIELADTNAIVAIAKTIAFVKSRRHVVLSEERFSITDDFPNELTEKQDELRSKLYSVNYDDYSQNKIYEIYMPRPESDINEDFALKRFMYEIIDSEKYLEQNLKEAFKGMFTNETFYISDFVTQISEIADLNGMVKRELNETAERYVFLWEFMKSVADEIEP